MASDITLNIGEALVGEGNEIAHIDLLIGSKTGPVGAAFANALANQSHGHSNLLAVLTPNLVCKPATVLITKVTIKGANQAVQMFGPAQAANAKIYQYNYEATKLSIQRAMKGEPKIDEIVAKKDSAKHPFSPK